MSLDIKVIATFVFEDGSDERADVIRENITYNVSSIYFPVMRFIGVRGGLRGLDQMPLSQIGDRLPDAIAFLDRHIERFTEREPENKWGGTRCVYRVLRALHAAHLSDEYRDKIISVC